jgi:hypothetical protein
MSKPDMTAMLQSFLAAQQGGTTVNVATQPEPVATVTEPEPTVTEPEPTPVEPTPELATVNAELPLANVDVAALLAALMQGQAPGNGKTKAKPTGKWESCDVEMPNGEKLHLRVAPKGYGCVGFEGRNDYSCFFGYRERHEAIANLFGDGYRKVVLDRLIQMGLRYMNAE